MAKKTGYSLIELLTVMAIGTILVGIGLYSLNTLNRRQVVVQSAKKLVADLRQTKSLADAQQKPVGCDTLNGYRLTVTNGTQIAISAVCINGNHPYQSRLSSATLENVVAVYFPVLQQAAVFTPAGQNTIVVRQNNQQIVISIGSAGTIDYE